MKLTPREAEVLTLMKDGWSNREIADALQCSLGTIKAHVRSIYRELKPQARRVWAPKGSRLVELDGH